MKEKAIQFILMAAIMLFISTCALSVSAAPQENTETYVPVSPELQSTITIMDGGSQGKITLDDVSAYHAQMEAEEEGTEAPESVEYEPCCTWMFRSLLTGIPELWGETIPERSDISITSNLVSCGALHTGGYVTGTGEGLNVSSPGRFILLKPDGTELTDYSHEARGKIAKNRTMDNYKMILTRISTGDSVTVSLREEVFPDGFLDLLKKIKADPSVAKAEVQKFNSLKKKFLENLLQKPDDELFTIANN